MNIVFFLIIGAIAGWLAAKVMQGRGLDPWINMGLGVVGGTLLKQLDMQGRRADRAAADRHRRRRYSVMARRAYQETVTGSKH